MKQRKFLVYTSVLNMAINRFLPDQPERRLFIYMDFATRISGKDRSMFIGGLDSCDIRKKVVRGPVLLL